MTNDLWGLVRVYVFLITVLVVGELLRRLLKKPADFTRKFIHIGVGFWGYFAWPIVSRWIVVIPPASFVLINIISHRWRLIPAMESEDRSNLGTIYYPLSICLLVLLFWQSDLRIIAMLGSMVMGLGDGFATIIGRAKGKHVYSRGKSKKSWEGSLAMFLFAVIAGLAVLLPYTVLPFGTVLVRSGLIALAAAVVEGLTPGGYDNLTVPLASAGLYYLLFVVL